MKAPRMAPELQPAIDRLESLGVHVYLYEWRGGKLKVDVPQEICNLAKGNLRGTCAIALSCVTKNSPLPITAASIGRTVSYLLEPSGRLLKVQNGPEATAMVDLNDHPTQELLPGTVYFRGLKSAATRKKRKIYDEIRPDHSSKGVRHKKHHSTRLRIVPQRMFYSTSVNKAVNQLFQKMLRTSSLKQIAAKKRELIDAA